MNDSIKKEDREQPFGDKKSPGRVVSFGIKLPKYGISKFNETLWDASCAWIINNLKKSIEGCIIELIRGDGVLSIPWFNMNTGSSLVLGFFQ